MRCDVVATEDYERQDIYMAKMLVTGGAGFIGSNLAEIDEGLEKFVKWYTANQDLYIV